MLFLSNLYGFITITFNSNIVVVFFSFHILGNAGQCLGYEFYRVPNLSQLLLNTVFTNLQYLPDFRTKIIINILDRKQ